MFSIFLLFRGGKVARRVGLLRFLRLENHEILWISKRVHEINTLKENNATKDEHEQAKQQEPNISLEFYMDVSENSGFSPQIFHLIIRVFPLFSPSILGETPLFSDFHPYIIGDNPWGRMARRSGSGSWFSWRPKNDTDEAERPA